MSVMRDTFKKPEVIGLGERFGTEESCAALISIYSCAFASLSFWSKGLLIFPFWYPRYNSFGGVTPDATLFMYC